MTNRNGERRCSTPLGSTGFYHNYVIIAQLPHSVPLQSGSDSSPCLHQAASSSLCLCCWIHNPPLYEFNSIMAACICFRRHCSEDISSDWMSLCLHVSPFLHIFQVCQQLSAQNGFCGGWSSQSQNKKKLCFLSTWFQPVKKGQQRNSPVQE